MSSNVRVRASKPSLIAGIVVVSAFLLFGIGFLVVLLREGDEIGPIFMAFWILVVLVILCLLSYNLATYDRKGAGAVAEVIFDSPETGGRPVDFEEALRKLDRLRGDGLLTEDEFREKRREIMARKW